MLSPPLKSQTLGEAGRDGILNHDLNNMQVTHNPIVLKTQNAAAVDGQASSALASSPLLTSPIFVPKIGEELTPFTPPLKSPDFGGGWEGAERPGGIDFPWGKLRRFTSNLRARARPSQARAAQPGRCSRTR